MTATATELRATVKGSALAEGVRQVGPVASRSTRSLPVLRNILVEFLPGALRLSANNLDDGARVTIPAEVEGEGVVCADHRLLDIVPKLPDGVVTVEKQEHGLRLTRDGEWDVVGLDPEEFPDIQIPEPAIHLPADLLAAISHQVAPYVFTEMSRPLFCCILFEFTGSEFRAVATDGHRLSYISVPMETKQEQVLVQPGTVKHAVRLFREGDVGVGWSNGRVGFVQDGREIAGGLTSGTYASYRRVIDLDQDKELVVGRKALLSAVERALVLTSDRGLVVFALEAGGVSVGVETADVGAGEEEVAGDYQGDPLRIGFNGRYLFDTLSRIPTDDVRMTFRAPERAAEILPVDADEDAPKLYTLCMPLRIVD